MSTETETRNDAGTEKLPNFVLDMVESDVAEGKNAGQVRTRFPPEPNGYLHIGHAKSICLNFGIAQAVAGATCNLRFDDTNPSTEEDEFVRSIQEDVRWLGFDWGTQLFFASDYFEKLYAIAEQLVTAGTAYVDSQTLEEVRAGRGSFYQGGRVSPYRDRTVAENLDMLRRMRAGEYPDGAHVLRAKIDMTSPNQNLRDPVMYRIKREHHHRTGDGWCIYPMYDFAHGYSDAIEGVTHSICTLEFENHRPLYDWFLDQTPDFAPRPKQIEFAKLMITFMTLSKRKLKQLVEGGHVKGWDDPRMPTLAGFRRRGYTPEAIRAFCERVGVSKRNSFVEVALLEHAQREHLNATSRRAMGVVRPLKVVLENYPEDGEDGFEAPWMPDDPSRGTRRVPFSRVLYVEREDFAEVPPKGWFRLTPGGEVHRQVRGRGEGRARRGRRAALHVGSRLARRAAEGRAQGEGHAALGLGEARRAGRDAPLRSPLSRGAPRRARGARARRRAEPRVVRDGGGPRRARARGGSAGRPRAARARRLLLRRPRLEAGGLRAQPHHRPEGLVRGQAAQVARAAPRRVTARGRPRARSARRRCGLPSG
jgi:glutaminyl-tRNA synthetase